MTTACGMIIMLCMSAKTQALLRKEISISHKSPVLGKTLLNAYEHDAFLPLF